MNKIASSELGKTAISAAKSAGNELASSAISTAKDIAVEKGNQFLERNLNQAQVGTPAQGSERTPAQLQGSKRIPALVQGSEQTQAHAQTQVNEPEINKVKGKRAKRVKKEKVDKKK